MRYCWVLCDRCTPIPGGPTISYTFRSVGTFNIITAENEVGVAQDSIFRHVLQHIERRAAAASPPTAHCSCRLWCGCSTNISYSWAARRDGGPSSGRQRQSLLAHSA